MAEIRKERESQIGSGQALRDSTIGIGLLSFLLIIAVVGIFTQIPNAIFATGPVAGVTIIADGKPLTNVYVVACDAGFGTQPNPSTCGVARGTTDGRGTFTYTTGSLWIHQNQVYFFTVRATQYAIPGNNYGITVVDLGNITL